MISAVVLTKNEEKNIKDCLEGLAWCDEIVVVDDNSQDRTVEISKKMGVKVYQRALVNDFSAQRNFAIEKAQGDWVLFIDADERVEKALAEEIKEAVKDPNFSGYFVKRDDFMFSRWLKYGETGNTRHLRLARKGAGKWVRPIHEWWSVSGNIGELKNPLLHYPHPTVAEFLKEINFYTTLDAYIFFQNGQRVGFWQIILYPVGKFFLNYFIKLGFLDGMAGFLMSLVMSFHSFLTRGKIWQRQKQNTQSGDRA